MSEARKRKPTLSVKLTARALDIPVRTAYHYIKIGRIPAVHYMNRLLVLQETVDQILLDGGLLTNAEPVALSPWFEPKTDERDW